MTPHHLFPKILSISSFNLPQLTSTFPIILIIKIHYFLKILASLAAAPHDGPWRPFHVIIICMQAMQARSPRHPKVAYDAWSRNP